MSALTAAIEHARTVRLTPIGGYDAKNRSRGKTLALETNPAALSELREALAIDETTLAEERVWMTPGRVELHFFDGRTLLATVVILDPEWIRWPAWKFDTRLREPARLSAWLARHGFTHAR